VCCVGRISPLEECQMNRVGQNHTSIGIHGVYTVFLAEERQIYGHIRCIYTVLANPTDEAQMEDTMSVPCSLFP